MAGGWLGGYQHVFCCFYVAGCAWARNTNVYDRKQSNKNVGVIVLNPNDPNISLQKAVQKTVQNGEQRASTATKERL